MFGKNYDEEIKKLWEIIGKQGINIDKTLNLISESNKTYQEAIKDIRESMIEMAKQQVENRKIMLLLAKK